MSAPNPKLEVYVLASGSKGNAALIGCGHSFVLVDCGIVRREMIARSEILGVSLADITGIVISHTHSDHTRGLAVLLRYLKKTWGAIPPIFCAPESVPYLMSAKDRDSFGVLPTRSIYEEMNLPISHSCACATNDDYTLRIHAFRTSHDVSPSFGFRFDLCRAFRETSQVNTSRKGSVIDSLAWMTDTGIVPDEAYDMFAGCRVMGIESNHDPLMLKTCDYPYALKERIRSDVGHLSNEQADAFLAQMVHPGLSDVIALHISENSNMFRYPEENFTEVLAQAKSSAHIHIGKPRTPLAIR